MTDEPIIATKERLGSYDAIETAKPDEPLFPIQGGDPFGPATVQHWADLARAEGRRLTAKYREGTKRHEAGIKLLGKATDAEHVAWGMQAYQRGQTQESDRAVQAEAAIEIDVSADHDRKVRDARVKAADRLHNIVGSGVDIADLLAGLDCCEPEVGWLRSALDQIKAVAHAVEPRRDNERS